jgi:hypothetical protein
MTRKSEKKRSIPRKRTNTKPAERGLGPDGGGWNIAQTSAWSGIGEASLRGMAKRSIDGDPSLFPAYLIGRRRILIPRQGFIDWFNRTRITGSAA